MTKISKNSKKTIKKLLRAEFDKLSSADFLYDINANSIISTAEDLGLKKFAITLKNDVE
ncbi:MAG: hypothetical protein H7Z76_13470 [Methylotenera sp.]|nr:hypothetical protein [Flavobacterium sp.]